MMSHNPESVFKPPPSISLLLVAALIGALAFLQVYSIQSVLPVLMHDLNINAVTAGSAVGATVLAVALMSPFTGMLSDALGRRWLIIASVLFLALPTAAMFWAQTITQIWWLRFLQGLSVPGITVVLLAYIGEEFSGTDRVRTLRPGQAVTMEYLAGRLNLYLDASGNIERIACG